MPNINTKTSYALSNIKNKTICTIHYATCGLNKSYFTNEKVYCFHSHSDDVMVFTEMSFEYHKLLYQR